MIRTRWAAIVLPLLAVGTLLAAAPGAQAQRFWNGGYGGWRGYYPGYSSYYYTPYYSSWYSPNWYSSYYYPYRSYYSPYWYSSSYYPYSYSYPSTYYSNSYYPYSYSYNYSYPASYGYSYPASYDSSYSYLPSTSNMTTQNYQSFYPSADEAAVTTPQPATVMVHVPADAQVWFDGTATSSTGPVREYASPPLQPGTDYAYDIRARWTENGQTIDRTRHIEVHSGERRVVDFTVPSRSDTASR